VGQRKFRFELLLKSAHPNPNDISPVLEKVIITPIDRAQPHTETNEVIFTWTWFSCGSTTVSFWL